MEEKLKQLAEEHKAEIESEAERVRLAVKAELEQELANSRYAVATALQEQQNLVAMLRQAQVL